MWSEPLAGLGPFFAVDPDPGPGWLPLGELAGAGRLDERVEHTRTVLSSMSGHDVEVRVAVSTLSLGLFARLISPVLAASVLDVPLPRPSQDSVSWQPVAGGPWPLALVGTPERADVAGLLAEVVLPLADVIAEHYPLSTQVLDGNVASALFGAASMLGRARPELAVPAHDAASALLVGRLAGAGSPGPPFVRASCCLYYRIPGGGYCGDCVLATR